MTTLLPVTIQGVEFLAHGEWTRGPVVTLYQEQLRPFADVLNLGVSPALSPTDVLANIDSNNYETQMAAAVIELIRLAKEGEPDPTDPINPTRPHFLNVEMAQAVDQIIKTLIASGAVIDNSVYPPSVLITKQVVKNWKNLVANSDVIRSIVQFAIDSSQDQNRTLQALVELVYVRTGNELLTENLNRLESALTTTKDVLATLSSLQDLHNKIQTTNSTQTFLSFASQNYSEGSGRQPQFVEGSGFPGLAAQASAFFKALDPTVPITSLTSSDRAQFLHLYTELALQISALSRTTPLLPDGREDSGSLLGMVRKVYNNLTSAIQSSQFGGVSAAGTTFLTDTRAAVTTLTTAATAASATAMVTQIAEITTSLNGFETVLGRITPNSETLVEDIALLKGHLDDIEAAMGVLDGLTGGDATLATAVDTFQTSVGASLTTMRAALQPAQSEDQVIDAIRRWILDNEQVESSTMRFGGLAAGSIQRNLTAAISAGQSLNDTQKEEVRRYLFVFEEYYKSAAAILSKITQILERMAQAIAR